MARARVALVSGMLLLACGGEEAALDVARVEGPAETEAVAGCFGGREAAPVPLVAVYEVSEPDAWVVGRAEVGRCDGASAPLDVRVLEERDDLRDLGTVRIEPSGESARASVAWLMRGGARVRIELGALDGEGPRGFVHDVRLTRLEGASDAVPSTVEAAFGPELRVDDALHLRTPARVRVATSPGVHTLSGDLAVADDAGGRVQLTALRAGTGLPPLMRWSLTEGGPTPFTVSWAAADEGAAELWASGAEGAWVSWRGLRHDHRPLALVERAPEPPPEPPPMPPRDDVALLFREPGATPVRCAELPAHRVEPGTPLVLPAGPARRLRVGIGPCDVSEPGSGRWRVVTSSGEALSAGRVAWTPGEPRIEWLDVAIPAATEIALVAEADGDTPLTWHLLRAPLALDGVEVTASGFAESDLNRSYAPEHAFDGNPRSEWHAPDGQPGWLELRLAEPITVRAIALLNGHNPGYDDRATRRFVLRAYAGERVVMEREAEFPALDLRPEAVAFPVGAEGVDRIRLEVPTHFGRGASIADIELL